MRSRAAPRLDDVPGRIGGVHDGRVEAGRGEQCGVLGGRALAGTRTGRACAGRRGAASACCVGRTGAGPGRGRFSSDPQPRAGRHRVANDAQDPHAVLVGPVVEDVREHVGVPPCGHLGEEVGGRRSRTGRRGRPRPSARSASRRDVRPIGDDTAKPRVPGSAAPPAARRCRRRRRRSRPTLRQVAGLADDRLGLAWCPAGPSTR